MRPAEDAGKQRPLGGQLRGHRLPDVEEKNLMKLPFFISSRWPAPSQAAGSLQR